MIDIRPIRFSAHWVADYSKYRVFWQAVFQPPRPYSLSLEHGSAPTQYRQLRRLNSGYSPGLTVLKTPRDMVSFSF